MDDTSSNEGVHDSTPSASLAEQPIERIEQEAAGPSNQENVSELVEELMEQDAPNPVAVAEAAPSQESVSQPPHLKELLIEKATYERNNFNLSVELAATKEKLVDVSLKRQELQEQLNSNANELNERGRLYRQMESSRNDLASRNISLEGDLARLKQEKEERDNAIKTLNRDKNQLMSDTISLKDELRSLYADKAAIDIQLKNLEQEKRSLNFERERAKADREVYEDSKRWFIKEMAEKDNKISALRIEISANELKWQNEKMDLSSELKGLMTKVGELEELLAVKQDALDRTTASIETRAAHHRQEVVTLETELNAKSELASMYKESLEKAEECANQLSEQMRARENIIQSTKVVLEEVRQEMDEERAKMRDDLIDRDVQITELREELSKANEMLKNKHAVSLNVTEDELALLSPAAAETSKILKGGMSLTSMMREQARLAGELAAERERSARAEETIKELVDEIESDTPRLMQQKAQVEKLFDESCALKEQLKAADEQRRTVEGNRDAAVRELAYTRAELEKYQRDMAELSKKHQHLLFVIDKERYVRETDRDELTMEEDRQLYNNIVQLQKRNMKLESELASERASAVQAAITSKNAEMENLRMELTNSQAGEERLATQLEQMQTAFTSLQEHSAKLAAMAEDNVSAADARAARMRAEEAIADLREAELKIARLEETLNCHREERASIERLYQERQLQNQNVVTELMATKSKLELKFEQQKQITEAAMKELEFNQKETERLKKDNDKLKSVENEHAKKMEGMFNELMKLQDQGGQLRVDYAVAQDELSSAKSSVARLEAQVEVLRSSSMKDQQMMGSLNDLTTRLSRMEAERQTRSSTQMEMLQMEQDTMKNALTRANNQLMQVKGDASLVQAKMENEITLLRQQLAEKTEQLQLSEQQLLESRTRLTTMQSQYTEEDNTDGMTPERLKKECQQLKNRVQYLESQTDELKGKLVNAEIDLLRKKDEMEKMVSHGGKMESGLKEIERIGEMERARLETRAQASENRSEELSRKVGELKTIIDEKETELSELRFKKMQAQNELQQRINIQDLEIRNAESRIVAVNESLASLQEELTKKNADFSLVNEELSVVSSELADTTGKLEVVQNQLATKERELVNSVDLAKMAEERRLVSEQSLVERNRLAEDSEAIFKKTIEENDTRLQEIMRQYDEVVSKISGANDPDLNMSASLDPDVPQAVIQSQQRVLQFIRDEKADAVERAMKAEVEVMRLKAETREIRAGHDEMVARIQQLQTEAAATAGVLTEKAELLRKVESLMTTQQQCQRLRSDRENLQKVASELQKKVKDHETALEDSRKELFDARVQCTNLTSQLESSKMEAASAKRNLESLSSRQNHAATAELDQLRSKLERATSELAAANTNAVELEKKFVESNNKYNHVRMLAIRYRDENTALKKKPEAAPGPSDGKSTSAGSAGTGAGQLAVTMESLKAEIAALTTEKQRLLDELASKNNDIDEINFRVGLLTGKVSKADTQIASLESEIQEKNAKIALLESSLGQKRASASASASSVAFSFAPDPHATKSASATSVAPVPTITPVRSSVSATSIAPVTGVSQLTSTKPAMSVPPLASSTATTTAPVSGAPVAAISTTQSATAQAPRPMTTFGRAPTLFGSTSQAQVTAPAPVATEPIVAQSQASAFGAVTSRSSELSVTTTAAASSMSAGTSPFFASSSKPGHGLSLFGKSAATAQVSNTSIANSSVEDVTLESAPATQRFDAAAGQSSYVSGSASTGDYALDDAANESAGESRDSTVSVPVSSTEPSRKRAANSGDETTSDAKRQRDSPNEAVTSSEEPIGSVGGVDAVDQLGLEGEDDIAVDVDIIGGEENVDEQSQDGFDVLPDADAAVQLMGADAAIDDGQNVEVIGGDDDADDVVIMEGEEGFLADDGDIEHHGQQEEEYDDDDDDEDDDHEVQSGSDGGESEMGVDDFVEDDDDEDDDAQVVNLADEDSDEDDDVREEDQDQADRGNNQDAGNDIDDELLAADRDDNSVSQPSLDDQDREAASAVEEADDEGRNSADGGAHVAQQQQQQQPQQALAGHAQQPSGSSADGSGAVAPRPRAPIVFDRDDQCSSSNESGATTSPARPAARGGRGQGSGRRSKPFGGIYRAGPRGRGGH